MSNEIFDFSTLLGPAVTVFAGQQLVSYVADRRDERKKRISAAEILLLEVHEGVKELTKFLPLMQDNAYIEQRLAAEGHAFYIPVDDAMEKVVALIENHMMLLPHQLVATVMRFYRNDRSLNELLRDLSSIHFASLPRDRKRELVRYVTHFSEKGQKLGTAACQELTAYIDQEKTRFSALSAIIAAYTKLKQLMSKWLG